jgi:hypothetical protein
VATIRAARYSEVFRLAEERAGAGFHVEDEGVEAGGELFAQDGRADEAGTLDGGGAVAQGVEDAVGGDQRGGLADDGSAAVFEDCLKFGQ